MDNESSSEVKFEKNPAYKNINQSSIETTEVSVNAITGDVGDKPLSMGELLLHFFH